MTVRVDYRGPDGETTVTGDEATDTGGHVIVRRDGRTVAVIEKALVIAGPKTLADVVAGDVLNYGAYGPCKVETVDHVLAGWNGKVPITRIRFTCGLGFEAGSDRPARIAG